MYTNFPDHFSFREMTHTQVPLPNVPTGFKLSNIRSVAWILESVRSHVGKPLYINSGFRCPEVNSRVGGARTSHHLTGSAVDISIRNLSAGDLEVLERSLLAHYPCEFLKYDTFWHVAFDISRIAKTNRPLTYEEEYPEAFPLPTPKQGSQETDF